MIPQVLKEKDESGIRDEELYLALKSSVADCQACLRRVLLIVPDHTRMHSNAGKIANMYYHLLKDTCDVELLEALGTHVAMTRAQCAAMYGDIPFERFIVHNWRTDIVKLGEVPGEYVSAVSEGLSDQPIEVEVNRKIMSGYDLVLSIGQVVPHEVVGMANQSKNIFVGCGGNSMINSSHMLGAFYGMERMMGRDATPVRKVFDYAEQHFLGSVPLCYVLTVTTAPCGDIRMHGLYIGRERKYFEMAVAHAQQTNLTFVDKPLQKVVVYLDPEEFHSTWLGNKAIYRTRMAMADGGQLVVLAPGAGKFGEDKAIDGLIRKYGYCGREKVIELCKTEEDLQQNLSAAAHLIHGSSDGRFSITYCTKHLSESDVRGVCFDYLPYDEAAKQYDPSKLKDGYNTINGEEIFYISNPALGLWADRNRF